MRRRDFLIGTSMTVACIEAAATYAATGTRFDAPIPVPVSSAMPIGVVFFTPRYPQSVQFAYELAALGARAFSTDCDVVRLWRGPVGECFAAGVTSMAGITLHSHLDILREASRELGLKVVKEALHTTATGTLASWVIGRRAA
ncbi:MAG: hypothetical protein ABI885_23495 [Gammaproteobacteria bacterium]